MTGLFGYVRDRFGVQTFGNHAPEAALRLQSALDEEVHAVMWNDPLLGEVCFRSRTIDALDHDVIVSPPFGNHDTHHPLIATGDAGSKCA